MSLYKPKVAYAAIESQFTAAGGEVQVPRGGINEWLKPERQAIDTRIGKANAVLRALHRSVATKRAFKHRRAVSFKSIFVTILTYGLESWVMTERILTQVQAPKTGFLRSPRCDKEAYRG